MRGRRVPGEDLPSMEEALAASYRESGLTPGIVKAFRRFLMDFYASRGRDLPWRRTTDPYRILVSEFMLQQTGVERVLGKYSTFLDRFPDVGSLARAPRREVLSAWQGLGYNRRAIALHETAMRVEREFHGAIPLDGALLDSFPGIGKATAGAIVVFSTNRPEIFIETNIRRAYIHLFFPGAARVHDREIEPILRRTLMRSRARDFYYALMDYGSALGTTGARKGLLPGRENPNTRSAGYARQSAFKGSDRQLRGIILRRILAAGELREDQLGPSLEVSPERLAHILRGLARDGFIDREAGRIRCKEANG